MINVKNIYTSFGFSIFQRLKFRKESGKNNKKEQSYYTPTIFRACLVAFASFMLLLVGIGVACATDYYVTLSGNNANDGTTLDTAWGTIAYAATKAQAGDTVKILAGNYGHEHVTFSNSGNIASPIVFLGVGGNAIIDAQDGYGYGFDIESKAYITLRNLAAMHYEHGFHIKGSNIIIDNVNSTNNYYYGIYIFDSEQINLLNSLVQDAGLGGVITRNTHNSLIANVTVIGTTVPIIREKGKGPGMDYYLIVTYGHNNTIRDIVAKNTRAHDTIFHPGHGIGIKDDPIRRVYVYPHSYKNKFYNITVIGIQEPFLFAHGAYDNLLCNFTFDSSGLIDRFFYGITMRDGAHDNIVRDGISIGNNGGYGIQLEDTSESQGNPWNENNKFHNIILKNNYISVYMRWSRNNTIENNVFIGRLGGSAYLFKVANENSNLFKNNIVTDHSSALYNGAASSINIIYSDFWGNGFSTPSGTGNIGSNPIFVNSATGDFHLKSQYGRWTPTGWVYTDTQTSPVIDAGDPASDYSKEPSPNGGRINMGAYGNTDKESKSPGLNVSNFWLCEIYKRHGYLLHRSCLLNFFSHSLQ